MSHKIPTVGRKGRVARHFEPRLVHTVVKKGAEVFVDEDSSYKVTTLPRNRTPNGQTLIPDADTLYKFEFATTVASYSTPRMVITNY